MDDKIIDEDTKVKMPLWKLITWVSSLVVAVSVSLWFVFSVYAEVSNKAEDNSKSIIKIETKNDEQDTRLRKLERNIDKKLASILKILETK